MVPTILKNEVNSNSTSWEVMNLLDSLMADISSLKKSSCPRNLLLWDSNSSSSFIWFSIAIAVCSARSAFCSELKRGLNISLVRFAIWSPKITSRSPIYRSKRLILW